MNNSDLADAIMGTAGTTKADARKLGDAVFEAISDAAVASEEFSVNGFETFKVKDNPEREGRNPATGEAMTFKASRMLSFAHAVTIKNKLNG